MLGLPDVSQERSALRDPPYFAPNVWTLSDNFGRFKSKNDQAIRGCFLMRPISISISVDLAKKTRVDAIGIGGLNLTLFPYGAPRP